MQQSLPLFAADQYYCCVHVGIIKADQMKSKYKLVTCESTAWCKTMAGCNWADCWFTYTMSVDSHNTHIERTLHCEFWSILLKSVQRNTQRFVGLNRTAVHYDVFIILLVFRIG